MIDIAAGVLAILSADANLVVKVGNRINPDRIPQDFEGQDSIVYRIIQETANMSLEGANGLDQALFTIEAYSRRRINANEIAQLAWQACDNFHGEAGGVQIRGVDRTTGVTYGTDRPQAGTDQYRYIARQDLRFTYYSLAEV